MLSSSAAPILAGSYANCLCFALVIFFSGQSYFRKGHNAELEKRIKEHEKQLEFAQMKNVALNTMIDISENDYKLEIRKEVTAINFVGKAYKVISAIAFFTIVLKGF